MGLPNVYILCVQLCETADVYNHSFPEKLPFQDRTIVAAAEFERMPTYAYVRRAWLREKAPPEALCSANRSHSVEFQWIALSTHLHRDGFVRRLPTLSGKLGSA